MRNSRPSKIKTQGDRATAVGMGLIALDIVISSDPSAPIKSWAGGTCGNVMAILSFLGWDSYPLASLNNNSASMRVKSDLEKCGVNLDFVEMQPTTSTPIIVQEISKNERGDGTHKFSWICPSCGSSLPNYKAVTIDSVKVITDRLVNPALFFFDRVSPAAIELAEKCKSLGAVVIFEPSVRPSDHEEFQKAINVAHILKYSNERFGDFIGFSKDSSCLLEIKTFGEDGLMFRSAVFQDFFEWESLPSISAVEVKDTCGCGDWTTAGFLSKTCSGGLKEFKAQSNSAIVSALRYGQELAAWNCQFEGARGGMYTDSPEFPDLGAYRSLSSRNNRSISCPACQHGSTTG